MGYRKPVAADGDILAALVHLGGPGAHGVDQIANTVRLIDRDGCDPTEDASGHVLLQTILDRRPAGGSPSWRRQHCVGAVQFGDRGGVFFVIRIHPFGCGFQDVRLGIDGLGVCDCAVVRATASAIANNAFIAFPPWFVVGRPFRAFFLVNQAASADAG